MTNAERRAAHAALWLGRAVALTLGVWALIQAGTDRHPTWTPYVLAVTAAVTLILTTTALQTTLLAEREARATADLARRTLANHLDRDTRS